MSRSLRDRYPTLARLFGAYCNQDFDTFGADPLASVAAFAGDVDGPTRAKAMREARALLARRHSEPGLGHDLAALRCGYLPSADGRSNRAFLRAVVTTLAPVAPPDGGRTS